MIVTYKDDVSTLDPAIGYDWQNWSMIKSLFDGLMDYEPGTTELRPVLAESYEISDDGQTFTFKLRQGVKFHNGREMTADDVKYSLDRVTNPKTQSPGAGFFGSIEGFDDVAAGKADSALRRHRRRSRRPSRSNCRGPTPPSCMSWRSTSPPSCRRKRSRNPAPISASIRSAPAPSSSPNGRSASASSSSATRTTGARACPISTRSPSRSARSRSSRCCACRRARSTFPATASRRPSSWRS